MIFENLYYLLLTAHIFYMKKILRECYIKVNIYEYIYSAHTLSNKYMKYCFIYFLRHLLIHLFVDQYAVRNNLNYTNFLSGF